MIIKYKGTDEHGVFRMGVTKLPNVDALHLWIDARRTWQEMSVRHEDGTTFTAWDHPDGAPSLPARLANR